MNTARLMNLSTNRSTNILPTRYIALAGSTTRSCKRLKLLLKQTGFYCLVDCYKNTDELMNKDGGYLPDCIIMEIRSLYAMFSINKRMKNLREVFPEIKVMIYYNMLRRCPLLEQKYRQYPVLHSFDDEQQQLNSLEKILRNDL